MWPNGRSQSSKCLRAAPRLRRAPQCTCQANAASQLGDRQTTLLPLVRFLRVGQCHASSSHVPATCPLTPKPLPNMACPHETELSTVHSRWSSVTLPHNPPRVYVLKRSLPAPPSPSPLLTPRGHGVSSAACTPLHRPAPNELIKRRYKRANASLVCVPKCTSCLPCAPDPAAHAEQLLMPRTSRLPCSPANCCPGRLQPPSPSCPPPRALPPQPSLTLPMLPCCTARCPSHELAARVGLPGLLVEHLAGQTQVVALLHQRVQLLAALEHRVNGLVQDDLRQRGAEEGAHGDRTS